MLGAVAEDKGAIVGIAAEDLRNSLDALAGREPRIAAALAAVGYPEPRISEPGYQTLLRAIVGQQVSVASAASLWAKLTAAVGDQHLLPDYRAQKRLVAGLADPRLGISHGGQRRGDPGLAPGQGVEAIPQVFGGDPHNCSLVFRNRA